MRWRLIGIENQRAESILTGKQEVMSFAEYFLEEEKKSCHVPK